MSTQLSGVGTGAGDPGTGRQGSLGKGGGGGIVAEGGGGGGVQKDGDFSLLLFGQLPDNNCGILN